MKVTLLIVAVVAAYVCVMILMRRRWGASRLPEPHRGRPVRTSVDHDPDNRYPFMSGDSF